MRARNLIQIRAQEFQDVEVVLHQGGVPLPITPPPLTSVGLTLGGVQAAVAARSPPLARIEKVLLRG